MGDSWNNKPIEIVSGVSKDALPLRKDLLSLLTQGMKEGATRYPGEVAYGFDPAQLMALTSQMKTYYGAPYAPNRGIRAGSAGGGAGWGGSGSRTTNPAGNWGGAGPGTGYSGLGVPPSDEEYYPYDPYACFVGDTFIRMADEDDKMIENVVVGDQVRSVDLETRKPVVALVTEVFKHEPKDAPKRVLINGFIEVTPDHLIFANGDYKPAGELKVQDTLLDDYGYPYQVSELEVIEDKGVATYNFHTDHPSHNYYADGILVHNAKKKRKGPGDDSDTNKPGF